MRRIANENKFKNNILEASINITRELVKLKESGVHIRELEKMFNINEKAIYSRISNYKKSVETKGVVSL